MTNLEFRHFDSFDGFKMKQCFVSFAIARLKMDKNVFRCWKPERRCERIIAQGYGRKFGISRIALGAAIREYFFLPSEWIYLT